MSSIRSDHSFYIFKLKGCNGHLNPCDLDVSEEPFLRHHHFDEFVQ